MGDDHAFLLCSSFNAIDRIEGRQIESFVIVGKAFPEGKTTYVMRQHKEYIFIYSEQNSLRFGIQELEIATI